MFSLYQPFYWLTFLFPVWSSYAQYFYSSCAQLPSCFQLSAIPRAVARQAPLSMGLPRQEYWNGLPFPSPGELPTSGIKPASPTSPVLAGGFFTTKLPGKSYFLLRYSRFIVLYKLQVNLINITWISPWYSPRYLSSWSDIWTKFQSPNLRIKF